jgi:hypothetical protein
MHVTRAAAAAQFVGNRPPHHPQTFACLIARRSGVAEDQPAAVNRAILGERSDRMCELSRWLARQDPLDPSNSRSERRRQGLAELVPVRIG